ncbi:uncharacterized protein PHACADRAFT_254087 [Phanerochaete carnosa HHB-10118-sp]|uniref:MHD domain-containing protein n=1 Tax=Phanerochaete carnosa (strain HHB-10118-sp) TaxID=650164 RepID=K5V2L5_PHACS|nr:uncharacterized protein PHACADRAFT_254087 [Phanerochaete carnosa HHB-10118-sp]EKM56771.1 hypothetical protein PHACADRAFT_254087 [Phanerochaete carnosa HHB-10118-sp]
MASLVAILDPKGKSLIQRRYRDDVSEDCVWRFVPLLLELEDDGKMETPCLTKDGVSFMFIRHSNLYLLAISPKNANCTEIILYLHRLVQVLVEYFGHLEEEAIRDNFVIIYELLDEMMDFGFPQVTESKMLRGYITQESYKLDMQLARPVADVTNAVSWRPQGIHYRKNEVFLDVIESVNILANADGRLVRSEVLGAVKIKCYLSGMPELRLGLNDKIMFDTTGRTARGKAVELEDVKFHQCVRLSKFESERTISFIPPDGDFDLMSYRISTPTQPLVWAEASVEHKGSRVEYLVKVKAQFKRRSFANNVEIHVPVPDDADSPKFRAGAGSVQYVPAESCFVWKMKKLGGGQDHMMRAHFGLPSVRSVQDGTNKRVPITCRFEIPYFTVSGIQVRYLKAMEKSGYQALPWVRYITQNGDDYSLRTVEENGGAPLAPI